MVTGRTPPVVEQFFDRIAELERWPEGVVPVPQRIAPPAFFSASDGLWREGPDDGDVAFPFGGIMIVGHNLDSEAAYAKRLAEDRPHGGPESRMATWVNLLATLQRSGIGPKRCFFTNAYVGLKAGEVASGKFAGESDPGFRRWCEAFLIEQIRTMEPAVIVALGGPARRFLAGLSHGLAAWRSTRQADVDAANAGLIESADLGNHEVSAVSLVHPSFGNRHVGTRRYVDAAGAEHAGAEAETAMLRAATRLRRLDP